LECASALALCYAAISEHPNSNERRDWQWLHATKGGFFLVFVDGKLATPMCANAAFNAWQALMQYSGLSKEQAEAVLGKQP